MKGLFRSYNMLLNIQKYIGNFYTFEIGHDYYITYGPERKYPYDAYGSFGKTPGLKPWAAYDKFFMIVKIEPSARNWSKYPLIAYGYKPDDLMHVDILILQDEKLIWTYNHDSRVLVTLLLRIPMLP